MSQNCSRKSFFAKLGGLLAAVGFAPAMLARMGSRSAPIAPVAVRPEQRAVARKEGSF